MKRNLLNPLNNYNIDMLNLTRMIILSEICCILYFNIIKHNNSYLYQMHFITNIPYENLYCLRQ